MLDPPRAGAVEQVRGAGRPPACPRVIYASCSPESFARDARMLVDGGFALLEVRPIDQFLYAAEVELVARFVRHAPRKTALITAAAAATYPRPAAVPFV